VVEFLLGLFLGITISVISMFIMGYKIEQVKEKRLTKALHEYYEILNNWDHEDQARANYKDLKRYKS
jgi:hypothetical protein